jgi:hypothetical protein
VFRSQALEAPRDRDISDIVPLTFEAVISDLRASATLHASQDPDAYAFADY